jgi:hypothetical protein
MTVCWDVDIVNYRVLNVHVPDESTGGPDLKQEIALVNPVPRILTGTFLNTLSVIWHGDSIPWYIACSVHTLPCLQLPSNGGNTGV